MLDFSEIDYPFSLYRLRELSTTSAKELSEDECKRIDDENFISRELSNVFGRYYKFDNNSKQYKFIVNSELFYGVTGMYSKNTECFQEGLWRETKVFELIERFKKRIPYFKVKLRIPSRSSINVCVYSNQYISYNIREDIMPGLIKEDVLYEYGYEYYEDRMKNNLFITISIQDIFDKFREKYKYLKDSLEDEEDFDLKWISMMTTNNSYKDFWVLLRDNYVK
jgi:hypothetical protein